VEEEGEVEIVGEGEKAKKIVKAVRMLSFIHLRERLEENECNFIITTSFLQGKLHSLYRVVKVHEVS
jgi:hypothetical protein